NSPSPPALSPLSLHAALPICVHQLLVTAGLASRERSSGPDNRCFDPDPPIPHGDLDHPVVVAADREACTDGASTDGASVDHERRSEEHTSELQSRENLVCRLL